MADDEASKLAIQEAGLAAGAARAAESAPDKPLSRHPLECAWTLWSAFVDNKNSGGVPLK